MKTLKAILLRGVATRDAAEAQQERKYPVTLSHPLTLRLREEDPMGQTPMGLDNQPMRNPRTGDLVKPFKITEHHYKKGINQMPRAHAEHPYVRAAMVDADNDGVPDYTVEQLEAMLAEAQQRRAGSRVEQGGGNTSSSVGDGDPGSNSGGNDKAAQENETNRRETVDTNNGGQGDNAAKVLDYPSDAEIAEMKFDELGLVLNRAGLDPKNYNSTVLRREAVQKAKADASR